MFYFLRRIFSRETYNCVSKAVHAIQKAEPVANSAINHCSSVYKAIHSSETVNQFAKNSPENNSTQSISDLTKYVVDLVVPIVLQRITNAEIAAVGATAFELYKQDGGKKLGKIFSHGANLVYDSLNLSAKVAQAAFYGGKAGINAACDWMYTNEALDNEIEKGSNGAKNFTMREITTTEDTAFSSFVAVEKIIEDNHNTSTSESIENNFSLLLDANDVPLAGSMQEVVV
ncbi:hypothetical protein OTUT144_0686 [Orientia tsutsugamushi str. UT144]|uniref:Uncharacterized protein n=1 Tax=Orientia tsutsugamushi str. UT144 TaxID=1441384 RepID=A0A0F3RQ62_ORITS|nr:hypothetical protein [Orientia tsutsugamushi]KJW05162.1 hypothetical protein OTUT144_2157 [Orientia tsutsugamushi str. UT144]KJW07254.1 hypothetical protein OTUT144_0686 [Orientia tsutsugamushi str. UT144]